MDCLQQDTLGIAVAAAMAIPLFIFVLLVWVVGPIYRIFYSPEPWQFGEDQS